MKKEKKVSFRVRRIYYDMFADGTKTEEFRTLKPYWIRILLDPDNPPKIAVIHTPGQPTLKFLVDGLPYIADPVKVLGRELSEQGKKDIASKLCIVTKMGDRVG